ncbi:MAG: Glucose-6-phosphate 3-dehydrogenase, partial [Planctomycetota bacterium]
MSRARRSTSRPVARGSRRDFITATAAVAGGYWIAPGLRADEAKPVTSANEEIRFACIGIGGKGASDSADAARSGKVVAVADVDANQLKRAEKTLEGAKQYVDFRKMF